MAPSDDREHTVLARAAVNEPLPVFREPSPLERTFNKVFALVLGLGIGPRHYYVLQVRGRKTGRVRSTPVNVVEHEDKRFLVAPRGRTQWVRNAEAAGAGTLKKGWSRERFRLHPVPDKDKPPVLHAYLDQFRLTVQRYFPVRAGAPPFAFVTIAERYPVFELLPSGPEGSRAQEDR